MIRKPGRPKKEVKAAEKECLEFFRKNLTLEELVIASVTLCNNLASGKTKLATAIAAHKVLEGHERLLKNHELIKLKNKVDLMFIEMKSKAELMKQSEQLSEIIRLNNRK